VDAVTGQVLLSALGVSISPVPVAATLVILLAHRAASGVAFLVGWITGIALVLAVAATLGRLVGTGGASGVSVWSVLALTIGVIAFALAIREGRRHRRGTGRSPAAWVAGVAALSPARALGVGVLLVAANPKNLALLVPAGIVLARARLPAGMEILLGALFVLVAGSSVLVPVVVRQVIGDRADPVLVAIRGFLARHETRIAVLVLVVVGTVLVTYGVRGLAAAAPVI
jgi:hypothetical protein